MTEQSDIAASDGPSEAEVARLREQFLANERAEFLRKNPHAELSDIATTHHKELKASSPKAKAVAPGASTGQAYLLWALCGPLSGHRIYFGAYLSAALQALLFVTGFAFIWQGGYDDASLTTTGFLLLAVFAWWLLTDLFLIPRLSRKRAAGKLEWSTFL